MFCKQRSRLCLTVTCSALLLLLEAGTCLAAKGGNGNGKPGGDPPPPVAPVTYSVTPVAIPGSSFAFYEQNNLGAMVGSLYDAPPGGRRALAYLPDLSADALYLDTLNYAEGYGVPEGWHTRSAVDINMHDTIVGNRELDDAPNTDVRPMYITGASSGAPQFHTLDPMNDNAWHENVAGINDSGDMLVWSQETMNDVNQDTLYFGNPGLYGQPSTEFTAIDFSSLSFPVTSFDNVDLAITNRNAQGISVIAGRLYGDGSSMPFRVNSDGTGLEIGQSYFEADGTELEWFGGVDVTDSGDITGNAFIRPAKKGKIKNNSFAAIWSAGSSEFLSAIGDDRFQSEVKYATTNNDGDLLLVGDIYTDTLWQAEWSATNGPIEIANLIDSDDLNASLFDYAYELLDRSDGSDWPTILASGVELVDGVDQPLWLVLTPSAVSTQLANSTAVPEPRTETLLASIVFIGLLSKRKRELPCDFA